VTRSAPDPRRLLEQWLRAEDGVTRDRTDLLQALSANATLTALLADRRWVVMHAARNAGASWAEIGDALGMSRQSAWEFLRKRVDAT
jgi:Homeodomain-like domain